MAWFGALLGLGGAIVSGAGQEKAGRKQKRAFGLNAAIEEQNAVRAIEAADDDILSLKREAARAIGAQRAGFGASGVSSSSGSAMDLLADSTSQAVLDQQRRKYAGELKAETHRNNARLGISSGKAAYEGARYGAAATVLSGASQAVNSLLKS